MSGSELKLPYKSLLYHPERVPWPSWIISRHSSLLSGTSNGPELGDMVHLDGKRSEFDLQVFKKVGCIILNGCPDDQRSSQDNSDYYQEHMGSIFRVRGQKASWGEMSGFDLKYLTKVGCIILNVCPNDQGSSQDTQDYCPEPLGVHIKS